MEKPATGHIVWGDCDLDLDGRELRRCGFRVKLQDLPFRILSLLLKRPGELVTREELRSEIWAPSSFGDFDHNLNIAINKLRAALNDRARHPRYIETVPRRGYRFMVPVESRAAPPKPRRIRLAVLPLANLSGNPGEEYFCDGLTEELITQLGRLNPERLGVISRTSAMRYKGKISGVREIGRELEVDYLLEGSVRSDSSQIRVALQLVHVQDQTQLWSHVCEHERADSFKIQPEVGRHVAESLAVELLPSEVSRLSHKSAAFTEAHEAYLKGRYHWHSRTEEGFRKALRYYESALEKDPRHGAAWAGIASAYMLWGNHALISPAEVFPRAKEAAMKALEIDPYLAEAHAALMFCDAFYDWDFAAAEKQYARAVKLNATTSDLYYLHGFYLPALGRFDEAEAEILRGLQLDPLNMAANANLCYALYLARRYEEAIERGRRAVDLDPGFWLGRVRLGRAYLGMGMLDRGVAEHEEAVRLSGGPPVHLTMLAYAHAFAGDADKARAIAARVVQMDSSHYVSPYFLAELYAVLGENDQAFRCLDECVEIRSTWLAYLQVEPALDPLRADARFDSVARRVGIPQAGPQFKAKGAASRQIHVQRTGPRPAPRLHARDG